MVRLAVLDLMEHEDIQGFVLPMAGDQGPERFVAVGTRLQLQRWLDLNAGANDELAQSPTRVVDLGKQTSH